MTKVWKQKRTALSDKIHNFNVAFFEKKNDFSLLKNLYHYIPIFILHSLILYYIDLLYSILIYFYISYLIIFLTECTRFRCPQTHLGTAAAHKRVCSLLTVLACWAWAASLNCNRAWNWLFLVKVMIFSTEPNLLKIWKNTRNTKNMRNMRNIKNTNMKNMGNIKNVKNMSSSSAWADLWILVSLLSLVHQHKSPLLLWLHFCRIQ